MTQVEISVGGGLRGWLNIMKSRKRSPKKSHGTKKIVNEPYVEVINGESSPTEDDYREIFEIIAGSIPSSNDKRHQFSQGNL